MTRKRKKYPKNPDTRCEVVGITVKPALKSLLAEMAESEKRTVSSLAYLLLIDSPKLKRKLEQAA